VLRLRHPLSEEALEHARTEFNDLVLTGTIRQGPALPAEGEEHPDLTRLHFHFNRRNMGRLRQLVDYINRQPAP
jgi:hypothetical protein